MSSANASPKSPEALRWPLHIGVNRDDGVTVLVLRGRIAERSSTQLSSAIADVCAAGALRLVIDFGGVDYISSAGLEALSSAIGRLREAGGALVACGVEGPVRTAFQLAAIGGDVIVDPSRRDAIDRLKR